MSLDWANLPRELIELPRWCVTGAGSDKSPHVATGAGLVRIDVTAGVYHSFKQACDIASGSDRRIGFVLTAADSFSCVDLDIKDIENSDNDSLYTTQNQLDRYSGIVAMSDSYCEISAGGKGVHCWLAGDIGAGRRKNGIEIYSRDRFIICTGRVVNDVGYSILNKVVLPRIDGTTRLGVEIRTDQALLNKLVLELGAEKETGVDRIQLDETIEKYPDNQIWQMASTASNADKFVKLCYGDWSKMNFPSQSEADLALLSMFTFYSDSNEQCRRLFRQTGLGQRQKATKNNTYLNRTLQLIRQRQNDSEKLKAQIDVQAIIESDRVRKEKDISVLISEMQSSAMNPLVATPTKIIDATIEWPPGVVGNLAEFIYYSSPRPVVEVAVTAALGLFAGICGKSYHTESQSGLNLYIVLIARSAIGKESMHSGLAIIINQLKRRNPIADMFVEFTDFASGPALVRACSKKTSFVNVTGEWGKKLQRLADENRVDGPMQQLRTVMTNLYQKSGPTSIVGGLSYSKDVDKIENADAIAYSMVGETTPGTFYSALTESMMEDGFLSRFVCIQYSGERPANNKHIELIPSVDLIQILSSIMANSARMIKLKQSMPVKLDTKSSELFTNFDLTCDDKIIKSGSDEAQRQIWNRAHLKALRIACLLAIGDNFTTPVVTEVHSNWAIALILKDVAIMTDKLNSGDIGISDDSRLRKLISIIKDFLKGKVPTGYKIKHNLIKSAIIPRKYLHYRISQSATFNKHRMGTAIALDSTIKTAIDSGYIVEVDKLELISEHGFNGRAFKAVDLEH